jgi:hypothetical protein
MPRRSNDIHDLLYQTARRGDLWMIKYLLLEAILKHEHNQDFTWLRHFLDKQAIYNKLEAIWRESKDMEPNIDESATTTPPIEAEPGRIIEPGWRYIVYPLRVTHTCAAGLMPVEAGFRTVTDKAGSLKNEWFCPACGNVFDPVVIL